MRTPTDNFLTWDELDLEERRRRTRFVNDVLPNFGLIDVPTKTASPRCRLMDQFLAIARRHGLDVGQAVEYLATHGLQRPAIAEKPAAAEVPAKPIGAEAA